MYYFYFTYKNFTWFGVYVLRTQINLLKIKDLAKFT